MRQRYSEPKRSMQISPQEFWLLSSWLPKRCCYRHRFSRGTIPWNCRRLEACALRSPETYCCRRRLAGYTEGKFRLGVHQKYRKIELSPSVGVPPAQGSGSKFDQLEVPDVEPDRRVQPSIGNVQGFGGIAGGEWPPSFVTLFGCFKQSAILEIEFSKPTTVFGTVGAAAISSPSFRGVPLNPLSIFTNLFPNSPSVAKLAVESLRIISRSRTSTRKTNSIRRWGVADFSARFLACTVPTSRPSTRTDAPVGKLAASSTYSFNRYLGRKNPEDQRYVSTKTVQIPARRATPTFNSQSEMRIVISAMVGLPQGNGLV